MKKLILIMLLIVITQNLFSQELNPVVVKYIAKEYIVYYNINGKSHEIVRSKKVPSLVNEIDNIYLITVNTGSPSNYTIFINNNTKEVSKSYFLVIAYSIAQKKVLYSDKQAVLKSIFDNSYYKEIELDYSPCATVFHAVNNVVFKNDKILFSYLSGDDYIEKEVEIFY